MILRFLTNINLKHEKKRKNKFKIQALIVQKHLIFDIPQVLHLSDQDWSQ